MIDRRLLWALLGCLALSAWAILSPAASPVTNVVAPVQRTATAQALQARATAGRQSLGVTHVSSPAFAPLAAWPAPSMDLANHDPFLAPAPPILKPVVASAPTAAPPPPVSVSYRFWGSFITPAGERLLYIVKEGSTSEPVLIRVGTVLDGGVRVEEITSSSIVLLQTDLQRRTTLSFARPAAGG